MSPKIPKTTYVLALHLILPLSLIMFGGIGLIVYEKRLPQNQYQRIGANDIVNIGAMGSTRSKGLEKEALKKILSDYIKQSSENARESIKTNKLIRFLGVTLLILTTWIACGIGYLHYLISINRENKKR